MSHYKNLINSIRAVLVSMDKSLFPDEGACIDCLDEIENLCNCQFENNPFCKNCSETDCIISTDGTCQQIRNYLNNKKLASLRELQKEIHEISSSKGWWDNPTEFGTSIALIHSELSEALEADRNGNPPDDKIPQYTGIEAELADVIIRTLDCAEGRNYNVIDAMLAKVSMNKTRTFKHGGKKY